MYCWDCRVQLSGDLDAKIRSLSQKVMKRSLLWVNPDWPANKGSSTLEMKDWRLELCPHWNQGRLGHFIQYHPHFQPPTIKSLLFSSFHNRTTSVAPSPLLFSLVATDCCLLVLYIVHIVLYPSYLFESQWQLLLLQLIPQSLSLQPSRLQWLVMLSPGRLHSWNHILRQIQSPLTIEDHRGEYSLSFFKVILRIIIILIYIYIYTLNTRNVQSK